MNFFNKITHFLAINKNMLIGILSAIILIQAFLLYRAGKREKVKNASSEAVEKTAPAKKKTKPHPPEKTQKVYKVAVVLDDWGYNRKNLDAVKAINEPITISILPNLVYSGAIAEELHKDKKEIILHLPLEPYNSRDRALEPNTITVDMKKQKIISILNSGLDNVRYAVGVSNHQGSKATTDKRVIGILFKELKEKNLLFLDSLTGKSVCRQTAREIGLKFASRSVFLDNKPDKKYIRKQINRLIKTAKSTGSAIGVGHDREITIKTLREAMAEITKNKNIKFVFVSELAK